MGLSIPGSQSCAPERSLPGIGAGAWKAACLERRWRSLSADAQYALKKGGHTPSILVARAPNFNVGEIKWAGGKLGIDTPLYQGLCEACKKSAQDGFFCYDEMFMWAHDLIDKVPGVIETMRGRF